MIFLFQRWLRSGSQERRQTARAPLHPPLPTLSAILQNSPIKLSPNCNPHRAQGATQTCACDYEEAERAEIEKERKALREQVQALTQEKERLAKVLAAALLRVSAAEAAAKRRRARTGRDLVSQLVKLRTELGEEKRARREDVKQKDAENGTLQAALAAAREAAARDDDERERFQYVLACNEQTGSISRTISHPIRSPCSTPCNAACGEWNAPARRTGAPLSRLTCHPDRWAAVLEPLTTGTVPTEQGMSCHE